MFPALSRLNIAHGDATYDATCSARGIVIVRGSPIYILKAVGFLNKIQLLLVFALGVFPIRFAFRYTCRWVLKFRRKAQDTH